MSGGGLGGLGSDLGTKIALEAVLADFGQARGGQNGGKMAELGAKMEPRWRQDDPRWGLAGHLEATWGVILAILGGLGSDLCKKGRSIKMNTTMAFRLHFRDLGGLGECTWRLLEATLGDLGHKLASLGRSWRQVGSFLARCCEKVGRRWPKMANLSRKSF